MKTFGAVKYDRAVNFTGRNGYFKQKGIEVQFIEGYNGGEYVSFTPVTSRGQRGHCAIEIPIENVNALINILDKIANE